MDVAWPVFDETYGSGRETAEMIAERVEMTLEDGAAGLFVRNGEMALRELFPTSPGTRSRTASPSGWGRSIAAPDASDTSGRPPTRGSPWRSTSPTT